MSENTDDFKESQLEPWFIRRWWLNCRVTTIDNINGSWVAASELYVPWWAWPFELLHRLIFGRAYIKVD